MTPEQDAAREKAWQDYAHLMDFRGSITWRITAEHAFTVGYQAALDSKADDPEEDLCKICGEPVMFNGAIWTHRYYRPMHPAIKDTEPEPSGGDCCDETDSDGTICLNCGKRV